MDNAEKILYEERKRANEEALKIERERIRALNTDNAIYFNFSYTALKLLGKNLYNNPLSAIAELVANGIDAKAKNIYVYIDMSDKAHSKIEIIDDGSGMNYDDLAEKYVWIGRNKREDEDLNAADKQSLMGRKGIGKLAALYLSNRYYIFSKKNNNETKWSLNVIAYKDSDFPKLDKVVSSPRIETQVVWDKTEQGTAIVLENVDLRRTGSKRIEGLKRNLSDYYLIDAIETKIWVAVVSKKGQKIIYDEVKKQVAYKNFYALFDNSGYNIAEKIRESIAFRWLTEYEHIGNVEHSTIILKPSNFITSGRTVFHKEDGTAIEKGYELKGWIGIHATIDSKDALDVNFMRNDIYQSNKLRLYVRNKLAVSNYFDMNPSTQAMANYIEGEISFDILDDDDLPDIATSSRQDFLDDERVEKLIELVTPIVSALFKNRIAVGNHIREETKKYKLELIEIEKRKKEEAEQAKLEAERLAREAEDARLQEELARKAAEQELIQASEDLNSEKRRNFFLNDSLSEDQISYTKKLHMIRINNSSIKNIVDILVMKKKNEQLTVETAWDNIKKISYCNSRIKSVLDYYAKAKFDPKDEYVEGDLFGFIAEYCKNISQQVCTADGNDIEIVSEILNQECILKFSPQDIGVLIENVISNSVKNKATVICFKMYNNGEGFFIDIIDNGCGLSPNADVDRLFEFGKSYTRGGTGVGLYHVKEIVKNLRGQLSILTEEKGFGLRIKIK